MLRENIQNDYKKADKPLQTTINRREKILATDLKLANRIEVTSQSESFITLKDHKRDFVTQPKCRLLNPNKSEIGRVSSHIIKRINTDLRRTLKVQQWRSTKEVVRWFNNIQNKVNKVFIQFDIVKFYPSISEKPLKKTLDWAKNLVNISDKDCELIFSSRCSLLYNDKQPWVKQMWII